MDFENDENLDYQLNKIASIVIKEKRLNKGYSLEDVVNRLNNIITRQSLYRYENNEARMKNNIFKKICLALNENPSEVWEEINSRFLNNINDTDTKNNNSFDELDVLYKNSKGIMSEETKSTIEFLMKKTIDNYEKSKNNKE